MKPLLSSLVFFIAAIIMHVIYCRVMRKKGLEIASFVVISLVMMAALVWLAFDHGPAQILLLEGGGQGVQFHATSIAFYILMIPFYIVFYHSVVIDSPTRTLLQYVRRQGDASYSDLLALFREKAFMKSRLDALVEHRIVWYDGVLYRLSPRGKLTVRALDLYQSAVQREKGG